MSTMFHIVLQLFIMLVIILVIMLVDKLLDVICAQLSKESAMCVKNNKAEPLGGVVCGEEK